MSQPAIEPIPTEGGAMDQEQLPASNTPQDTVPKTAAEDSSPTCVSDNSTSQVSATMRNTTSIIVSSFANIKRHRSTSSSTSTSSIPSLFMRMQHVKPSATPNLEGRFKHKNTV